MTKLTAIESIGDTYAEKLKSAGIGTVEKLLEKGGEKKGRVAMAKECDISEKRILNWVNRADLARIKGVSTQYADLLECAGVDTVPELGQRNAANLHTKMNEVNETKKLVKKTPALSIVEDWIKQAKTLPRAINY